MAASFSWKSVLTCLTAGSRCYARNQGTIIGAQRWFHNSKKYGSNDEPPTNTDSSTSRDPFPVFCEEKIQNLLHRIMGFDAMKIAGPHKKPLERPSYKLLTDEELQAMNAEAEARLRERLQIPPYMNPRKRNLTPLSVDPDLAGFDTSTYVFTDISFGIKDRHRNVVVREPDGTLKIASWDVKERMNHIYNQREGRHYLKPKMFEEQHLERMISEKQYLYILDRACCQFEPDDPDFIRATHRVYNAIDSNHEHHVLRSSRHFGSLAFYLVWHHMIDFLLLDMMNRDLSSDALDLISLYCIVHPDSECAKAVKALDQAESAAVIKAYIEAESKHKGQLELALQAMEDARRTRERNEEQIKGSTS